MQVRRGVLLFSSISSVSATARPRSDGSRVLGALARRDALWRTPSPAVDAVKIAVGAHRYWVV